MRLLVLSAALLLPVFLFAQKVRKEDRPLYNRLQQHIAVLAADSLEGRRTGTAGEGKAAQYITTQFTAAGLQPRGTAGYLQAFNIDEGRQVNGATLLQLNGNVLKLDTDFFPMAYSGNGSVEALAALTLKELATPWFYDVAQLMDENKGNPHFDLNTAVKKQVETLHSRGASAVLLYNSSEAADGLAFEGRSRDAQLTIPVVYLRKQMMQPLFTDSSATIDLKLKTDVGPKSRTGHNVIAYLDNGAPNTVVLGAHYDHLGYGEDGNSMQRGVKAIHNGADDNASGTAALMELSQALKASKYRGNNYLFIAFSGEELGLFGSKYFVENPTIDLSRVSYMINMDMLGRLNDSSKTVTVGGYGTSPLWGQLYNSSRKRGLQREGLTLRFDSSGTGPSDHSSFYRKDVPVLFFFTGLHTDYHRPTDDADKINYIGELSVIKHILSLIEQAGTQKPLFTKTREQQMGTSTRFSVSLGIMPDYTFTGGGVRVDGVSEGRAAQKAGMKTGDVITAIGAYQTSSVEEYMKALSRFKKGDSTTVTYKRGTETLTANIQF